MFTHKSFELDHGLLRQQIIVLKNERARGDGASGSAVNLGGINARSAINLLILKHLFRMIF